MENSKTAIIIGAGPAGLTAAYELLTKTDIKPIIFEASNDIGGLAKTVKYKNNFIDIGGHRFFSKSQLVTDWWLNFFPLEEVGLTRFLGSDPSRSDSCDQVMLSRNRLSRIYFLGKFFDYPISLNMKTISALGLKRMSKIMFSYAAAKISPKKPEKSLEDFFINRFGYELYNTFFKDYTEKVWGVGCKEIKADWGAQRIRGLSAYKTLLHAIRKVVGVREKVTETTLIDKFMYPKFGPGQFWECVADKVLELGGEIHKNSSVIGLENSSDEITAFSVLRDGKTESHPCDYVFSSMPIKDLIASFTNQPPLEVLNVSSNLQYRDFITVGLLLKKMPEKLLDNWIYIQDREVKLGRLQIFNNWSPYLVADENNIWLGLEYFCFEDDNFWSMTDAKIKEFAIDELEKVFSISKQDVLDGVVIRVPKAYPTYFGVYDQIETVKRYADRIENLFLIGRNGMHKYNNMDHSMLAAIKAVDNIVNNVVSKDNIWKVNVESEYHEQR